MTKMQVYDADVLMEKMKTETSTYLSCRGVCPH